ncbi:MAG TPA: cupin domain-containing protein [Terriglobales bacterium]|nr:cupin domain-containing protein [Terriglobales bacterium]
MRRFSAASLLTLALALLLTAQGSMSQSAQKDSKGEVSPYNPSGAKITDTPPGIFKSSAEIMKTLELAGDRAKTSGGAGVSVTNDAGSVVAVRRRASGGEPQYSIIHPFSYEIYQVVDGSATLVTGGSLTTPLSASDNPDIVRSKAVVGGKSQKLTKGDVVVIPNGTAHWFSHIDGSITYLEGRVRVIK